MNNVLITGAAGFIGAATMRAAIDDGYNVFGLDSLQGNQEMAAFRRIHLLPDSRGSFKKITDVPLIMCEPYDAVIHLAATPGVRGSLKDPESYYDNNLMQTAYLLQQMRKQGIKKLVFASTSSVYDWANAPYWATSERTSYVKPRHPYAGSKLAAEELCRIYHEQFGMDITILRYFTVYGPSGRPDMFPLRVVRAITEGLPIKLNGNGKQKRDFTYIDDVVNANIKALDLTGFQILNIGHGMPYDLQTFIEETEIAIGEKAIIEHQDHNPLDIPFTWADYSEAEKLMGWRPETGIVNGIRRTAKWYNGNREALKAVKF